MYSVAWVGAVSNMCHIFLFLVFSGLSSVFSFIYEFLITALAFFRKFIKLSSVLRKYCIARYASTSLHAIKKEKSRMGYQVVPHALSKPIWRLVPPLFLKALWLSPPPL